MDEYISREAVVRYLKEYSDKECNSNSPYGMITSSVLNKVERALSEMPAADVQPVIVIHSRWIPTGDGTYNAYCENCGQERGSKSWNKNDFKYCFGCGARMDLDSVTHDRCSNYMDCDGSCFIDDTPCDCNGNIEKCQGR